MIAGAQEHLERTLSKDRSYPQVDGKVEQNPAKKLFESLEKHQGRAQAVAVHRKLDCSFLIAKKKTIVNEKACLEKHICELAAIRKLRMARW